MADLSDYAEKALLDHICKTGAAFTQPDVYVALCTAAPVDGDTGATITEVADAGAYARQGPVTFDAATLGAGTTQNTGAVTFPVATAAWGTVTHVALLDSATHGAGNMLWHKALTGGSKTVGIDDQFKINIGDLDLALA